jgi:hypothetical protein
MPVACILGRFPRNIGSRVSYDVGGGVRYSPLAEDKRRREGGFDQDKEELLRADPMGTCWGDASAGKRPCSSLASELLENTLMGANRLLVSSIRLILGYQCRNWPIGHGSASKAGCDCGVAAPIPKYVCAFLALGRLYRHE